jgi:HK97 family phage major capsid protein
MADMNEVKDLIESQGRAWEEFKHTNDARLKALETQRATGDYDAKLAKIDSDLNEIAKKINRPGFSGAEAAKGETPEVLEHKQRFTEYLRKGNTAELRELERKAMNSTSDPDGGYLVTAEMESAITRVVPVVSAMARVARTVTIGTRSWVTRAKTSGMSVTWPGEGATSGESTTPDFARIEIVANVAEVEPHVYNETLEDADINLAADLANEAGIAFAEGEADAFIDGIGVGKPMGLLSYTTVANASYAWGSIGYIASGKAAAFASVAPADYIINLQHALKQQYRPGARWMMADSVLAKVRQIKDASSAYYLWNPDPSAGFGGRLLGSPVEIDDNMPATTSGSLSIAYGDFNRAYAIVRRSGISLIRDNITSKGLTKFNFRRRVGGGVINFEAVKVMKFSAS